MLDKPCSEVVWRVLATHSIHQFPLHFPPCVTVCHHISTGLYTCCLHGDGWCTTFCRLSTTAYLIYSHLSSISGGRLLSIHNLLTSHGDRETITYVRVLWQIRLIRRCCNATAGVMLRDYAGAEPLSCNKVVRSFIKFKAPSQLVIDFSLLSAFNSQPSVKKLPVQRYSPAGTV